MNYLLALASLLTLIHTLRAAPAPETSHHVSAKVHVIGGQDDPLHPPGCPDCWRKY
ncbi:hypothetical protein PGT21_018827 [Puccinia graminis f. sp. tritici]|uniref:Uncharacterized protein n=1 Tax=Puccinia graminis f. sp. tritici TaxID=56615 RepID=A0A5B0S200_PUCGR|nr:hypothetical protein PGT21_018827 [Puccinia graminis f. sp. tritici]KAA1131927.1 hypothetical protein PGTUg99_033891 [Puccinia graminis f. sp. tritici]